MKTDLDIFFQNQTVYPDWRAIPASADYPYGYVSTFAHVEGIDIIVLLMVAQTILLLFILRYEMKRSYRA